MSVKSRPSNLVAMELLYSFMWSGFIFSYLSLKIDFLIFCDMVNFCWILKGTEVRAEVVDQSPGKKKLRWNLVFRTVFQCHGKVLSGMLVKPMTENVERVLKKETWNVGKLSTQLPALLMIQNAGTCYQKSRKLLDHVCSLALMVCNIPYVE